MFKSKHGCSHFSVWSVPTSGRDRFVRRDSDQRSRGRSLPEDYVERHWWNRITSTVWGAAVAITIAAAIVFVLLSVL